jgi:hypothetical protein
MPLEALAARLEAVSRELTSGVHLKKRPPEYIVDLIKAMKDDYPDLTVGDGWKPGTHEWWLYKGSAAKGTLLFMYEIRAYHGGLRADHVQHVLMLDWSKPALKRDGQPYTPREVREFIDERKRQDYDFAVSLDAGSNVPQLRNDLALVRKQADACRDGVARYTQFAEALKKKAEEADARLTPTVQRIDQIERMDVGDFVKSRPELDAVSEELRAVYGVFADIRKMLEEHLKPR